MSAVKNGCDYIGFDLIQEYVDMAEKNILEEEFKLSKPIPYIMKKS